jgi:hypothetical protein
VNFVPGHPSNSYELSFKLESPTESDAVIARRKKLELVEQTLRKQSENALEKAKVCVEYIGWC